MKKEYKKIIEIEEIYKVEYFCDKCGKEIKRDPFYKKSYKIISNETESQYDCGTTKKEYAYFCEKCFKEIKEMLENIGVKFSEKTSEW